MKTLLIIAYVSLLGRPSISVIERHDIKACRVEAQQIYKNVKAGSVRAWCVKVPK